MSTYDVIVIGAGPAGEVAAGRLGERGYSVAIVERQLVGGECSYWGCMPSKALLRPGDVLAAAGRVPGVAEHLSGEIDLAAAFERRNQLTGDWDDAGQVPWLTQRQVEVVRGIGRLAGERLVEVEATNGTRSELRAKLAVVVATGTRAAIPPIPGLVEAQPWTNREVTEVQSLPEHLVVIGGGAIGCEMAQALKRLGTPLVTIIEIGSRLLLAEEPFAGEQVEASLRHDGIDVILGATIESVSRHDGQFTITLADREVTGDALLVAAGRRPATGDLGLDSVGLEVGRPIAVDDQMRAVGVEGGWLYAVGDCNGRSLLTHMGKYQARLAADVISGWPDIADIADHRAVTRVTFTDPQVAAVGFTEAAAREHYSNITVATVGTGDVAGAAVLGRGITGTCQLVIDASRSVIVGATFTGPDIAELLHSATIAVVAQVPLSSLWHAVAPFPTVSEVWLRLLESIGM